MNDKQKLLDFMKSKRLMQLATASEKPWICTVYYAIDDSFNLYFISEPTTRHCKDIKTNPNVAVAVTDSRQNVKDKKVGVQLQGTAFVVKDKNEMLHAVALWNKAMPGIESIITVENIESGKINSNVCTIKPKLIKFFNERLYGPEGVKVFEF